MSLIYISNADDEDTHKCKAHELTRKNDTDFTTWRDKLIRNGVAGIQEWDRLIQDYADPGKRRPKNPNTIGPPVSYMKDCGVFQPLPSTTNPLGLCHFYPADPSSLSTLTPPKPPTTVDHLHHLLVLLKSQHQPYIIVVFQGGPIMPLGLLQELHSRHTLTCIPIFLPDETKDGHRLQVSCCPFCTYTIQNDLACLNHIINAHYHTNFVCGTCLGTMTMSGQQMKRHISEWPGLAALPEKPSHESAEGECSPKKCTQGSPTPSPNMGEARTRRVVIPGSHNQARQHLRKAPKLVTSI